MNRRQFLIRTTKFGAIIAGAPSLTTSQRTESWWKPSGLPMLQGLTTDQSTQITIVIPKDQRFKVYLTTGAESYRLEPMETREFFRPESASGTIKIKFTGLIPGHQYRLWVESELGNIIDSRTLTTLDLKNPRPRIAFISCANDSAWDQFFMWKAVIKARPDLLFFIGDNVYAGLRGRPTTPERLWSRHIETWSHLWIYHCPHLIPTLATWDDHDYGANNGDRTYPHKQDSLYTFNAFYGQQGVPSILEKGPGVASCFFAFGQRFVLFDGRSFRDPESQPNASHWGEEQESWLSEMLAPGPFPTWLINGSQFFGAYHKFESVEGKYPKALERLLVTLKRSPSPALFVSGDKHYSEIMDLEASLMGYPTVEITSSSIHSFTRPYSSFNPRRRTGVHRRNFVLCQIKAYQPSSLSFQSTSYGRFSRSYFSTAISIAKPRG